MTYTIRPGFTITLPSGTFTGGQEVELTPEEFEANRHKLEGVGSNLPDINPGSNDASDCCYAPFVSSISPTRLFTGFDAQLKLEGSFFNPDLTIEIDGVTVNSVEFKSDNSAIANITVGSEPRFSNLTIDNGRELIIENAIELLDPADSIIDLRLGGTEFSDNAIEVRSGMSWERTADGLVTSGVDPWSSWMRLPGPNDEWTWDRSEAITLSLILANDLFCMAGIGSMATDPNSNRQYEQGEILAYMSSGTNFSGIFGNSGTPGARVNFNQQISLTANAILKITFQNNGQPGSEVLIHELPNADIGNWLDTSNLAGSVTVPNNFTADEQEIMPFVIPRTGSFRLLGMIFG